LKTNCIDMTPRIKIRLISSDGYVFDELPKVACMMGIVKWSYDDLVREDAGENVDAPESPRSPRFLKVPILNVSGDILGLILEYCRFHADDDGRATRRKEKEKGENNTDNGNEWHRQYAEKLMRDTPRKLFEVSYASDYVDLRDLSAFTCKLIADAVRKKSVNEIRNFFMIDTAMTLEEEENVRKEYSWAFD